MLEIDRQVETVDGLKPDAIPDDVLTSTRPLLLKGLVADWPFVRAARDSVAAAAQYLLRFYKNTTVGVGCAPPEIKGRFFYNSDLSGFNFDRGVVFAD